MLPSPSEKGRAAPGFSPRQKFLCELTGHRSLLSLQQQCYFRMALGNYEEFSFLLTVKPDLFQCLFKMMGISEIFRIIKGILTIRKKGRKWLDPY